MVLKLLFRENQNNFGKKIKKDIVCVAVRRCAYSSLASQHDPARQNFEYLWNSMVNILENDLGSDIKPLLNKDKRDYKSLLNKLLSEFLNTAVEMSKNESVIAMWNKPYVLLTIFYLICIVI